MSPKRIKSSKGFIMQVIIFALSILLLSHCSNTEQSDEIAEAIRVYRYDKGKWEKVKVRIKEKKLDVNLTDEFGVTNLMQASAWFYDENEIDNKVAKFLIANGANVNLRDNLNFTALHYATECSKSHSALLLIRNGADVNARTKNGRTPLHFASKNKLIKVTLKLLENGAKVDVKDNKGRTPLSLIDENLKRIEKNKEVVRLLTEYSKKKK